tara:strand:+ start:524 stop:766 length:243 start_codon:yes stop_codon:yes gene_type:complete
METINASDDSSIKLGRCKIFQEAYICGDVFPTNLLRREFQQLAVSMRNHHGIVAGRDKHENYNLPHYSFFAARIFSRSVP